MSSLPRSTPEAQGLTATVLDDFVAALDASSQEIQTVMLVKNGHVVLEEEWSPYRLADPHLLFSVSKSFTSMAVGLAIEAGLLTLDDKVVSFFTADELPATIGEHLAAMEVRHLLTMTTGHSEDTVEALTRDRRMVRIFLGLEVEHAPGTAFVYNSGATYMLSAILQRLTGERLLDYLRPRLFEPLGVTEATWDVSREGITTGGWGLSISTESLAKFGQFLLQRGEWEGRQLVPAAWIDEATAGQVDNSHRDTADWRVGYGYQFWRARHNAYRGDGAFGQFCLVLPDHDTAVIITSAGSDMQATMDTIWAHLLPALEGRAPETPLAPRPEKLELLPPTGPAPTAGDGRTYTFEPTVTGLVAVRLDPDGTGTFTLSSGQGTQEIRCAPGDWQEQYDVLQEPKQRIVTSAHGGDGTFTATIRFLETPFVATFTCRPADQGMTVDAAVNVAFGPTEHTLTSL
ncbi:CubicO group peptidase (beta-lactamase class C family) [Kribbella amoyensis]|uniref:CubicO group peptidase (Beta-lactamase class C family) n=1 Tax=Kribbella amoyensis TaxID=996641 RepID=A0A561BWV5_9ACTN|nr:serine hydrolase [Kribbella amoyensis]TWD83359.1 CubicO group peptidase (beta-lactamase class C family) [Kribbella amoyensis]